MINYYISASAANMLLFALSSFIRIAITIAISATFHVFFASLLNSHHHHHCTTIIIIIDANCSPNSGTYKNSTRNLIIVERIYTPTEYSHPKSWIPFYNYTPDPLLPTPFMPKFNPPPLSLLVILFATTQCSWYFRCDIISIVFDLICGSQSAWNLPPAKLNQPPPLKCCTLTH